MIKAKLRIGVLMGGRSIEREVSFNSGRTICDHLDGEKYIVIPLFQTETGSIYLLPPHFLHRGKIADFRHRLEAEAEQIYWDQLKNTVDFVYLAIHGRYAEDGTVQGMLEVMGIPYLGAKILGSALGMNKIIQKQVLQAAGIHVPKGISLSPHQISSMTNQLICQQLAEQGVSFPVVIKPAHEGSSLGITIVSAPEDLMPAVHKASLVDARLSQAILIEEKVTGMEFVCTSLQKIKTTSDKKEAHEWYSLPLTEVALESDAAFFDYEQKYMPGKALKITPARCSVQDQEKIMQACEKTAHVLQFVTISRIDGFLTTDGRVVIIDPNSLTGMSPATFIFHQAAEVGMSHTDLINLLIASELHAYGLGEPVSLLSQKDHDMTKPKEKKRIAVLFGGDSNEREISLESGRNICYKLSPEKYDVLPIFVHENMDLYHIDQKLLIKNATRSIAQNVTPEMRVEWAKLPQIADFVFLGLHGGKGESGAVQGALEMLDMPYNGSGVLASALCMDKFKTNNFLRAAGFSVPSSFMISKMEWLALEEEQKIAYLEALLTAASLTLPVIVKPYDDGCSVMVSKVTMLSQMRDVLDTFFVSAKTAALIEELIVGTELTCGVIGNDTVTALPPSMAVARGGILSIEEKFLPGAGENQTPAPLESSILALVQKTMEEAYRAIGCKGYARIDSFYQTAQQSPTGHERVVLLEFNTLPAMTPATCFFHQAAEIGMRPMELIDKIVEFGFKNHAKKAALSQPEEPIKPVTIKKSRKVVQEEEVPGQAPQSAVMQASPKDEKDLFMSLF